MINRRRLLIIFVVIISAGALFLLRSRVPAPTAFDRSKPVNAPKIDFIKQEINGKKIVGLRPNKTAEDLKNLKVMNSPAPDWEPALRETLELQGGSSIKDIKLNKVDSFVWVQDGIALFVESLIVTIKNTNDVTTSFRVLVDAQNGKILKNWDHPIIDPVHPKENLTIKVDPRYHGH